MINLGFTLEMHAAPHALVFDEFTVSCNAVNAGGNKPTVGGGATTSTGKSAAKLDNETEDFHRESGTLCRGWAWPGGLACACMQVPR